MKYVCLCYSEERTLDALSEHEFDVLMAETLDCVDTLQKSGQLVAAERLDHVHSATTVRVRNGKLSVSDGPFAETKEQLGGFFLISARDLNDAIRIASNLPPARLGTIEIRPIEDLSQRRFRGVDPL